MSITEPDGTETESVEEEMTRLWDSLDAERGQPALEVTADDLRMLDAARTGSDWHGLLHHLRLCAAALPPVQVARWRSEAWAALQFPQLAGVFRDFVGEFESSPALWS